MTEPTGPDTDPQVPEEPRAEAGPRPEAADGDWHRVHPISPWVRGWVILVAMLFVATQNVGEDLVRSLLGAGEFVAAEGLWITLVIYAAVFVVVVVVYYFSWRFTKYQLGDEQVLLDSGVVFRQHRRVRYDRVQAVDIRQPLLARIFGLAELKFEAADGGNTAMQLAFIKEGEARILRAEIMGRAAGLRAGGSPAQAARHGAATAARLGEPAADHAEHAEHPENTDGQAGDSHGLDHGHQAVDRTGSGPDAVAPAPAMPEAPERVMLQVPLGRVIGALLLSTSTAVMVGILVAMVLVAWILEIFVPQTEGDNWWIVLLFTLVPFLFSLVGMLWSGFNKGYNFTVATSPDGMRLRYGLLETTQQTVPPGRVQAVRIQQGLFWRPFGWYKVIVNVAGYGAVGEGSSGDKSVVLPAGTFDDVMRVLSVVAPEPGVENAPDVIRAGIEGLGDGQGFTPSPRRVRWLDPLTWRRNAYRSTSTLLLLRSGRLERFLVLLPHERLQSVAVHQGPLERRLAVATLRFHSTPGPVAAVLAHADAETAARLYLEEADIAAVSRRMRDRNEWMRAEELERFEQRTRQVVQQ